MPIAVRTAPVLPSRTGAVRERLLAVPSEVWVVAAITALGAALRFATLTSQSYWYDEASAAHEMQLGLGAMLHAVRVDESTPPLYYVLAWLWARIFGTGEAGLRSLSALVGTAVIPITYLCGRELVSRSAGYVAATLAAVSPFMIWYSQEARAYMLFAAFSGLSLLFFARARRDPSRRNLIGWGICSSLALLTQFFAVFLVAPEALWLLAQLRSRSAFLAASAVGVVGLAVLPLALDDLSHPLLGWIKQFPLHIRIEQVPVAFGLGTLYQSSAVTHGLLAAALLGLLVAALIYFGGDRGHRSGAAVAAAIAALVLLVPLLLAVSGRDYYIARNLIAAWIPLAVVLGAACTSRRSLAVGLPLAVVALGAFVYAGIYVDRHPLYQRPDWRGVAAALGSTDQSRAVVAYDGDPLARTLTLYLRDVPWNPPPDAPVAVNEVDVVGNPFQTRPRRLPAGITLLASTAVHGFQVDRFALEHPWRLTPVAIGARARTLLGPAPPGPAVLLQPGVRASQ